MSDTISDPELPNDYIIPSEYYDRYRLVFSHYHIDRKIGRIGMNGRQRKAAERKLANSFRTARTMDNTWNSDSVSREGNHIQELISASGEVTKGQHLLN